MTIEREELPEVDTSGWNEFLHSLRSAELRRLRPVDGVLLSAGCSGSWYFDWIAEEWPGRIDRHIGVEAYSPRPDALPEGVEWIAESIGAGTTLAAESVDVVFAGQAIEHFWVDEMVTFLNESWRVLRPDGRLVLDSPNRRVTEAIGWWQPEHTIELTPDEAIELVELAGFEVTEVRGIWSCFDRSACRFLPLEPSFADDDWALRVAAAVDRPEDSFCWWIECRKSIREPDLASLRRRVARIAHQVIPRARGRVVLPSDFLDHEDHRSFVTSTGDLGVLRFGPYVPLPPGDFEALFQVRRAAQLEPGAPAMLLDVVAGHDADETLVGRTLLGAELADAWTTVALPFRIDSQRFSVQFRAFALQPQVSVDIAVDFRHVGSSDG